MRSGETKSRSRGRSPQTHRAAQYAVASELCKRGYEVEFTSGQTAPVADFVVVSPRHKEKFLVGVKGLYKKNSWPVKRKAPRKDLYFILVYVPPDQPTQFFVMTHQKAHDLIQGDLRRLRRPDDYSMTGVAWNLALPHENAWHVLPE